MTIIIPLLSICILSAAASAFLLHARRSVTRENRWLRVRLERGGADLGGLVYASDEPRWSALSVGASGSVLARDGFEAGPARREIAAALRYRSLKHAKEARLVNALNYLNAAERLELGCQPDACYPDE